MFWRGVRIALALSGLALVLAACSSRPGPGADDSLASLLEDVETDTTVRFPRIGFAEAFPLGSKEQGVWKLSQSDAPAEYSQRWSVVTLRGPCADCSSEGTAIVTSQVHHNHIRTESAHELETRDLVKLGDGDEYWLRPQQTLLDLTQPGRHCLVINSSVQIHDDDGVIATADVDQVVLIDVAAATPIHCNLRDGTDEALRWTSIAQGESFGCGFGRFLSTPDSQVQRAEINACATDQLLVAVPIDETGRASQCCHRPVFFERTIEGTVFTTDLQFDWPGRWRTMLLTDLNAFELASPPSRIVPIAWPNTDSPDP